MPPPAAGGVSKRALAIVGMACVVGVIMGVVIGRGLDAQASDNTAVAPSFGVTEREKLLESNSLLESKLAAVGTEAKGPSERETLLATKLAAAEAKVVEVEKALTVAATKPAPDAQTASASDKNWSEREKLLTSQLEAAQSKALEAEKALEAAKQAEQKGAEQNNAVAVTTSPVGVGTWQCPTDISEHLETQILRKDYLEEYKVSPTMHEFYSEEGALARYATALKNLGESHSGSKAAVVLDTGTSIGEILQGFLQIGFSPSNLYGVDVMPSSIATARTPEYRGDIPESHFCQATLSEFRWFTTKFDLITSNGVAHHATDVTATLWIQQAMHSLSNNGVVVWSLVPCSSGTVDTNTIQTTADGNLQRTSISGAEDPPQDDDPDGCFRKWNALKDKAGVPADGYRWVMTLPWLQQVTQVLSLSVKVESEQTFYDTRVYDGAYEKIIHGAMSTPYKAVANCYCNIAFKSA